MASTGGSGVPVIDVSALVAGTPERKTVAAEIAQACRAQGFFYVTGHGVDPPICDRLVEASRRFFALDQASKMQWRMPLGGRAWRGYFPAGGELTSGRPDWKEGLYLGSELSEINGSETFVHVALPGGSAVAHLDGVHPAPVGTPFELHVEPERLLAIHRTGRLAAAPPAEKRPRADAA